jgi:hypothetical protein
VIYIYKWQNLIVVNQPVVLVHVLDQWLVEELLLVVHLLLLQEPLLPVVPAVLLK